MLINSLWSGHIGSDISMAIKDIILLCTRTMMTLKTIATASEETHLLVTIQILEPRALVQVQVDFNIFQVLEEAMVDQVVLTTSTLMTTWDLSMAKRLAQTHSFSMEASLMITTTMKKNNTPPIRMLSICRCTQGNCTQDFQAPTDCEISDQIPANN